MVPLDYDFVISDHYWLQVAANSNSKEGKNKIAVSSGRVEVDDDSVSRYTEWTDEVDRLIEKTGPLEGGLQFWLSRCSLLFCNILGKVAN